MKYRWLYLLISGTLIIAGVISIIKWGFNVGIEFTGGIVAEYKFPDETQKVFRYPPKSEEEIEKIRTDFKELGATEVSFESVGPTIGPELVKKTIYAIAISAGLILLWIAYQFKSFKFGISAIIATIHDGLILLGAFSLLGHFFGAEIDFLFVTAILTIISFSVHDTIVVFDRIRERKKKFAVGGDFETLANESISETMVRSLNNSFTIIFMLIALILLGGESIKWFSVALLVGTVSGTYSSPFVAIPILVTWDELQKKLKK
ncbi:MAG TPA: protein translocase subunit SecF [Patescibacteria group bacterium]|nr:protein translocase subunit SecF [Patescibacteria group bacterium]